jgi:hypothetical protein
MVFLSLVVFGFSTKPLTMIRLFAELSGHYLKVRRCLAPRPERRRVQPTAGGGRGFWLKSSATGARRKKCEGDVGFSPPAFPPV